MDFKSKFFKNPFSYTTIIGLISLSSIQVCADQGQRPIFREMPGSDQMKMAPANPLIVKRQRPVTIQSEAIEEDIETLNLNLFDDTNITVKKDRLKQNRRNQFTWKGHIDGVKRSEVVIVMDPTTQQMSGTVNTPDRCFHIRPDGQGEHVVQEIEPFLTETAGDEQNTGSESEQDDLTNLSEEEGGAEQPLFFDQPDENDGETVIEDEILSESEETSPTQEQPFYRKSRSEYIAHFNRLMRERYQRFLQHRRHHQNMFDNSIPEQQDSGVPEMSVEQIPVDDTTEGSIPEEEASNTEEMPVETEPEGQLPVDETAVDTAPEEDASNSPDMPVVAEPEEQLPGDETAVDTIPEEDTSNTPEVPVNAEPVDQTPAPTEEVVALDPVATEDGAAATNADEQQNNASPTPNDASTFEQQVLDLVNQERAIRNLHPLVMNSQLVQSARAHSADMAQQRYFSHTSLDGRSPGDRIESAGYQGNAWGENIAQGQTTPEEVMNSWMNSPGHAANILHRDFCDIGVGYEPNGRYWTQNFGRKRGLNQCQ